LGGNSPFVLVTAARKWLIFKGWMGGRVVEGTGLENLTSPSWRITSHPNQWLFSAMCDR